MRTVHVRIRHDDNTVVSEFTKVECLSILLRSYAHPERGKHILNLVTLVNLVLHRLFHVEDFTSQRKDGLKLTVPTLLSRTTCRVTLNKVNLTLCRIII